MDRTLGSAGSCIRIFITTSAVLASSVDLMAQDTATGASSMFHIQSVYVVAGVLLFCLQLALIVGLVVQRVRIGYAEEESRSHEARNSAMLRAVPDLMFVMKRDGTYLDYHAKDQKLLYAPPSAFLGKKVRDIMPADLAETFMTALERASQADDTVVVEYELPIDGSRHFEARLVRAGSDRILSMCRDVTESKKALQVIRDLGGRLIASQESERERIARELHDDVSQKIALLNIGIQQLANDVAAGEPRDRLQQLSAQAAEIATDIHNLSYELHPSRLQTLGLVATVSALCADLTQQTGIKIAFSHGMLPHPIDSNVSLSLYRIVQEALHNVTRHSGARDASVQLMTENGSLLLRISDSGVGFDPKQSQLEGLGLISMRERAAILRGELDIHAAPGSGTRIDVRVPLAEAAGGGAMETEPAVSRRFAESGGD